MLKQCRMQARKGPVTAAPAQRGASRARCAIRCSAAGDDGPQRAADSSSAIASSAPTASGSSSSSSCGKPLARRAVLGGAALGAAALGGGAARAEVDARRGEIFHTDEEWRQILNRDAYKVLRKGATEPPFSSSLYWEKRKGTFVCAGCGSPLFPSATKYDSGTGWPSFYKPADGSLEETLDTSIWFMPRTEYRCAKCKGHIGHVFNDGPEPTGLRYCCNGLALQFIPDEQA